MTKLEQVYGGSLYDLAKEEGLTEQIGGELRQVLALFDENPDYGRFLATLSIAKTERGQNPALSSEFYENSL